MKSHESSLLSIAIAVYKDAIAKCTVNEPDVRDLDTLRNRVKHEGLSFLTLTLPTLGADLETCLDEGELVPTLFRSFRKRGKAPAFLQGFFAQVFDVSGTGGLLYEPSVESIEGIRQIAYTFKKLRIACRPARVSGAIRQFKQSEHDLAEAVPQPDLKRFALVSHCLWNNCFSEGNFPLDELTPKHGPGATRERISGNQKYNHRVWHDRLEPYFPLLWNAFANESATEDEGFKELKVVHCEQEEPVRVITVPKTLKGPRIIAIGRCVCNTPSKQFPRNS